MRLLITAHPGRGHLYPAVSTGAAARRAGHVVAVATGPAYADLVTGAGLEHFEAGLDWDQSAGLRRLWGEETIRRFAADLDPIVRSWKPDIILREETELAGWIVGDAHSIPVATLGLGGNIPPRAFLRAEPWIAPIRSHMGAPPAPEMRGIHRYLYLDQYPAGWVPAELQPEGVYHTIGAAVLGDPVTPVEWSAPQAGSDAGRPHLYATLGTVHARQPKLLQTILDALGRLDVTATVTVGPAAELEGIVAPDRVQMAQFIPQAEVLPRSAAVVCHAGTGTVLGALRYGVPLVLIPIAANQPWTAELAERAGVALRLLGDAPTTTFGPWPTADHSTIRSSQIVGAVQTILADPGYRSRAAAVARDLNDRWQSGIAVTLLERLAATGQPVTSAD